ncbi:MAG: glycosyltransferase [Gammaproteobacteria bacterium]|nr:glycosyltransferase [Gammaproteobacteria bacterium]
MSQPPVSDVPLKIALLGYRSAPHSGGQGIYLKYLSRSLARRGHQVTVISGPPYPQLDPEVTLVRLPSLDLYEHGLKSIRPRQLLSRLECVEWFSKLTGGFAEPYTFGERVKKWFVGRESEFDIIHDNQTIADGTLALQHRGLPLVTTIHHPITKDYRVALASEPRWYMRLLIHRWHSFLRMQKRVAPQLQSVVTVSGASAKDISDDFNVDRSAISVMHLGVDSELFRPLPDKERESHRLMTTASADAPLKGLSVLLHAIASLRPDYPGIRLTLVGRPKPGGDTERLIASLGLERVVESCNGISHEEMVQKYASASVAVVPSIYEGFGLPAVEAMACGVPLVSTDGGALAEVVEDAGLVVSAGDAKALANAIRRLFEDDDLRSEYASRGLSRVEQHFCWNRCAERMEAYYRDRMAAC